MEKEIENCLNILKQGGIILYPTDTIWGIGCDATNSEAVSRVFRIKKRKDHKSMIILLDTIARLHQYIDTVPEMAYDLVELADKPLTIVYADAKNLAENLIANDQTIAIRITDDPFCKKLIERFRKPVVSTSANIAGMPHPENFSEISNEVKDQVDYIVGLRQNETKKARPSSIIKLGKSNEIEIIRK